jgi:glutamate/tyrosine decarboxylase-like PLP-dependent enzyme
MSDKYAPTPDPAADLDSASLAGPDLDPEDWSEFRALGHRMLDEMVDYLSTVRERPAWQPVPDSVRLRRGEPLSAEATPLAEIYRDFRETVLPFPTGNIHPRFFGWVHGSGTPTGMLAELLAAGMNANLGGREHGAVYVERQVIGWCRDLFGFPATASGLLVTGTSLANLLAIAIARTARLGIEVRRHGLRGAPRLTAYAARTAHACIAKAMETLGLGSDALRLVPTDRDFRLDLAALRQAIAADRADGAEPFLVIGTAGTVDTGAIDDLAGLADLAAKERLWLHVDGAFGALAALSATLKPRLAGIERADSLAFDFHKWAHVPYDAGCVLVRDGEMHRATFAQEPSYLARYERGTGSGAPWFADYGIDLSRGFRALKVWFTLREHGTTRLGAAILKNCRQAEALGRAVAQAGELELMAPVALDIVCFRHCGVPESQRDALNKRLVVDLWESGVAVPSSTVIDGKLAIRVNLTNHRTTGADLALFLATLRARGAVLAEEMGG